MLLLFGHNIKAHSTISIKLYFFLFIDNIYELFKVVFNVRTQIYPNI